jgi:hypothetical protein
LNRDWTLPLTDFATIPEFQQLNPLYLVELIETSPQFPIFSNMLLNQTPIASLHFWDLKSERISFFISFLSHLCLTQERD